MATNDHVDNYNAGDMSAPSDHDHLLKRLALTFGGDDPFSDFSAQKGVAIREIQDNAIDEVRGGYADKVRVSFFKDRSVSIQDNGRGIPVDVGRDSEGRPVSGIYMALGLIRSGGKFSTDSNRFSTGLNGVGAASTVHSSKRADVTVFRYGKTHQLSFKDGTPGFFDKDDDPEAKFTPLKDLTELRVSTDKRPAAEKKLFKTGTIVKVWLRDEVYDSLKPYSDQDIIERLRSTVFLVPNLHAEVYNELKMIPDAETGKEMPQREVFNFPDGLSGLIDVIRPSQKLTETFELETEGSYVQRNAAVYDKNGVTHKDVQRRVPIRIAMSWGEGSDTRIDSYVNTIHTKDGGNHVKAFEKTLVETFNERIKTMRGVVPKGDELPILDDFKAGLTAIVSVEISEPGFKSQTKDELKESTAVSNAISHAIKDVLSQWINDRKNSANFQAIVKKVVAQSHARQSAANVKEMSSRVTKASADSLPAKLMDCEFVGSPESELFICEGDSALGSLKGARDGRYNALFPVRGKIINAHKTSMKRVLENEEAAGIATILGAGVGKSFDIEQMRYNRIIMAVDADPDGNGIATLLFALFWHLFPDVIHQGRLYKVETPLFQINTSEGKQSRRLYAKDEEQRDSYIEDLNASGIKFKVTRLKGLGEVEAHVLAETAINPETRIMTRMKPEDAELAAKSIELIFGSDTQPRKDWILHEAQVRGDTEFNE